MSEVVNLLYLLTGAGIGAGLTYFVQTKTQERAWKRENALTMREKVYGPIYRGVSKILENIESIERPEWEVPLELKERMDHYLFFRIEKDLKSRLYALLDKFNKYWTLYTAIENKVLDVIRDTVEQTYHIDIGRASRAVTLYLKLEDLILHSITLEQSVLRGIVPKDLAEAGKKEWRENILIEANIGGPKKNLGDFQSLYEDVLSKVKKETLYQEEKKQRKVLISELEDFLKQIEKHLEID